MKIFFIWFSTLAFFVDWNWRILNVLESIIKNYFYYWFWGKFKNFYFTNYLRNIRLVNKKIPKHGSFNWYEFESFWAKYLRTSINDVTQNITNAQTYLIINVLLPPFWRYMGAQMFRELHLPLPANCLLLGFTLFCNGFFFKFKDSCNLNFLI